MLLIYICLAFGAALLAAASTAPTPCRSLEGAASPSSPQGLHRPGTCNPSHYSKKSSRQTSFVSFGVIQRGFFMAEPAQHVPAPITLPPWLCHHRAWRLGFGASYVHDLKQQHHRNTETTPRTALLRTAAAQTHAHASESHQNSLTSVIVILVSNGIFQSDRLWLLFTVSFQVFPVCLAESADL